MSFLSTIINIKNLVTGGSAKVRLEIGAVKQSQPFKIMMQVAVAEETLKIEGAYLLIQGIEDISVPHRDLSNRNEKGTVKEEMIRSHTVTSEQKIEISDDLELDANEKYIWNAVAELAPRNQPAYVGKYCKHYYRIKAYIDCYGNDPDSGWINLNIIN